MKEPVNVPGKTNITKFNIQEVLIQTEEPDITKEETDSMWIQIETWIELDPTLEGILVLMNVKWIRTNSNQIHELYKIIHEYQITMPSNLWLYWMFWRTVLRTIWLEDETCSYET